MSNTTIQSTELYFPWIFTKTSGSTNSSNVVTNAGETPIALNVPFSFYGTLNVPEEAKYLYICTIFPGDQGVTVADDSVNLYSHKVDDTPTDGSKYLVESNGVYHFVYDKKTQTSFVANNYFFQYFSMYGISNDVIYSLRSSTHKFGLFRVRYGEKYTVSGNFRKVGSSNTLISAIVQYGDERNIGTQPVRILKFITTEGYDTFTFEVQQSEDRIFLYIGNQYTNDVTIQKEILDTEILSSNILPNNDSSYLKETFSNNNFINNLIKEIYIPSNPDSVVINNVSADTRAYYFNFTTISDEVPSTFGVTCSKNDKNIIFQKGIYLILYDLILPYNFIYNTPVELKHYNEKKYCPAISYYFENEDFNTYKEEQVGNKSDWFLANRSIPSRETLKIYLNGIKASSQLDFNKKKFFIKDTESGITGTAIHDATIAYDSSSDILYMVSCCNNTNVGGDNPKSALTTARLDVIRNYSQTTHETLDVTAYTPARSGDTVDGFTIATGTGVPNIIKVDDSVFVFYTASDIKSHSSVDYEGKWSWFVAEFDTNTNTFVKNKLCKFSYNGVSYDFNLPNIEDLASSVGSLIIGNKNQCFNNNSKIAEYNGEYYIACMTAHFFEPLIFKTSDFVNWQYVCTPDFKTYGAFECPLHIDSNGIMIICTRGGVVNTLASYNLATNKWVSKLSLPANGDSRPTFFTYLDNTYLWYTPLRDRNTGCVIKINTDKFILSNSVFDVMNVGSSYPSVVNKDANTLIVSRSVRSVIAVNELTFPSIDNDRIDSVFKELFSI